MTQQQAKNANNAGSPVRPLSLDLIKPQVSFPYNILNKKGEVLLKAGVYVTMNDMERIDLAEDIYYPLPVRKIDVSRENPALQDFDFKRLKEGAIFPFALLDEQGYVLLDRETRVTVHFIYGYQFLDKIFFIYDFEKIDLAKYSLNPVQYDQLNDSESYLFPIVNEHGQILFHKSQCLSQRRKLAFEFMGQFFLAVPNQIKIDSYKDIWSISASVFRENSTLLLDGGDQHDNLIFRKGRELSKEDMQTIRLLKKLNIGLMKIQFNNSHWSREHIGFMQKLVDEASNPVIHHLSILNNIDHHLLEYIFVSYSQNTQKLLSSLQDKSEKIYSHSVNIGLLSLLLIIQLRNDLGFQFKDETEFIEKATDFFYGALLHDIGMIKLKPETIAKNTRDMTQAEKLEYSSHPQKGYEILQRFEKGDYTGEKNSIKYSDITKQCVLFHHERYDDRGYPTRLPYDGLPSFPKWIAILEVFDTLIQSSRRPDKDLGRISDALKGLVNASESLLDLDMVTLLVNNLSPILMHGFPFYKRKDYVVLEGDDLGVIETPASNFPLSPRVQILYNGYGKKIMRNTVIDLRKDTRKIKKFLAPERVVKFVQHLQSKYIIKE